MSFTPPLSREDALAQAASLQESGRYADACQLLVSSLQAYPHDAGALAFLGQLYLLQGNESMAADAIAKAHALQPKLPAVQRNMARLALRQGQLDEALWHVQAAQDTEPDNPENWVLRAAVLSAGKNDTDALLWLNKALAERAEYAEALAARAMVHVRAKAFDDAMADAQQALQLKPHLGQLWKVVAALHKRRNDTRSAMDALENALTHGPDDVDVMVTLGDLRRQHYRVDDAIALLRRATTLAPRHAGAWANLGAALHAGRRYEQAVQAYEAALALKPDMHEVANNLGAIAQLTNAWDKALVWFEKALQRAPENVTLLANKGQAMLALRRPPQEVAAVAQRILALNPKADVAYNLLGRLSKETGKLHQAIACYQKSLQLKPDSAYVHTVLGSLLKDTDNLPQAERYLRRSLQLDPQQPGARSTLLFVLNYQASGSPKALKAECEQYGAQVQALAPPWRQWCCHTRPRRLRVGFVSGDLGNHPVGYFLEGLLRGLRDSGVELVAYVTHNRHDAGSQRLQALFHRWVPCYGRSDDAVAAQIHDDGMHVLIDLSGHTGHNRLSVFARRPAPVQATWLGYFATTGVAAIDYILGDPYVLPENEASHFVEAPWRLPETYLCFTPPHDAPAVAPLPALEHGGITFGSFNNLAKMNDAVVALWARVLQAVPGSRLLLKTRQLADPREQQAITQRFASCGVGAERLLLEGPSPRAELLAAYGRVDMALDPFPYPGGTTSAEALWMGVPVLTRRGDRFLSHVGESVLTNAGLPDWIADGDDDYIARARAFAGNVAALAQLRAGLRARVQASPLFDAPRFARHFEEALWGMWQSRGVARMAQQTETE